MNVKLILIANTAAIVIITSILAYLITIGINTKRVAESIREGNRNYDEKRLLREIRQYTRTIQYRMSRMEKIELYLIDRSNIRKYIPYFNAYALLITAGAIFILTLGPVYRILKFFPSTALICLMVSLIPALILDMMGKYNAGQIRRKLSNFVSVLLRWYMVRRDIFYSFEKSIGSGIGEPLESYIKDMVIQVKRGMDPIEALDLLKAKVENEQFGELILNIKQCVKHSGDTEKLLSNMEKQFFDIEIEFNRRNISTYKDRMIIICTMFSVILIAYMFLKVNPKVYLYYFGTVQGKWWLTLFMLLYFAGFYVFTQITKFEH